MNTIAVLRTEFQALYFLTYAKRNKLLFENLLIIIGDNNRLKKEFIESLKEMNCTVFYETEGLEIKAEMEKQSYRYESLWVSSYLDVINSVYYEILTKIDTKKFNLSLFEDGRIIYESYSWGCKRLYYTLHQKISLYSKLKFYFYSMYFSQPILFIRYLLRLIPLDDRFDFNLLGGTVIPRKIKKTIVCQRPKNLERIVKKIFGKENIKKFSLIEEISLLDDKSKEEIMSLWDLNIQSSKKKIAIFATSIFSFTLPEKKEDFENIYIQSIQKYIPSEYDLYIKQHSDDSCEIIKKLERPYIELTRSTPIEMLFFLEKSIDLLVTPYSSIITNLKGVTKKIVQIPVEDKHLRSLLSQVYDGGGYTEESLSFKEFDNENIN